MRDIVVVTATNTGVGKTWVAAHIVSSLRLAGEAVAARKPVQSFDPLEVDTDRDVLARESGETPERVCPPHRSYELPMAPPMAASALGRPRFNVADLIGEMDIPRTGVVLVEGVGGPASPLAEDGDTVALADALDADRIILVAPPGLGTINDIRLSAGAFGTRPVTVFLNRFDDGDQLHRANRAWLVERCGFEVHVDVERLAQLLKPTPLEVT